MFQTKTPPDFGFAEILYTLYTVVLCKRYSHVFTYLHVIVLHFSDYLAIWVEVRFFNYGFFSDGCGSMENIVFLLLVDNLLAHNNVCGV